MSVLHEVPKQIWLLTDCMRRGASLNVTDAIRGEIGGHDSCIILQYRAHERICGDASSSPASFVVCRLVFIHSNFQAKLCLLLKQVNRAMFYHGLSLSF